LANRLYAIHPQIYHSTSNVKTTVSDRIIGVEQIVISQMWLRFLKSSYRREPLSSFILIAGAVDAVMGGVGDRWSLMTLGIGSMAVAVAIRLWKLQQCSREVPLQAPIHYLPERASRPQLPALTIARKSKRH